MKLDARITRSNVAYVYDCNECDERYVGYGDSDKKLQRWLDRHNNWHTGNARVGRSNTPPEWYMP